jgi:hypothetical protein
MVFFFFFVLGTFIENLPLRIVMSVAALSSMAVSFRMTRRYGKAQKAKVEEEYQRFLEKRKNQIANHTQG